jgi:dihydropteroate synthase
LPPGYLHQYLFEISEATPEERNALRSAAQSIHPRYRLIRSVAGQADFLICSNDPISAPEQTGHLIHYDNYPVAVAGLLQRADDFMLNRTRPLWKINDQQLDFNQAPLIMGILNVTPDSFSDGGCFADVDTAVERALQMTEAGADIIDIGGESSRPGSLPVTEGAELQRVLPVIEQLRRKSGILISVDTYKSEVARQALQSGANIVNDISGCRFDPKMPAVVAGFDCPLIIMHIKGTPRDMQRDPHYDDVMQEIYRYFEEQLEVLGKQGISKIIIDPGFGFGKRLTDNLTILRDLRDFQFLGAPLLIGTSRKSFIGAVTGKEVQQRLSGSLASQIMAVMNGADIVRVHDVQETRDAIALYKSTVNLTEPL